MVSQSPNFSDFYVFDRFSEILIIGSYKTLNKELETKHPPNHHLINETLYFKSRITENMFATNQPPCRLIKYDIAMLGFDFDCVLSPEENVGSMKKIERKMRAGGQIKKIPCICVLAILARNYVRV